MKQALLTVAAAVAALIALVHFWRQHERAAGLDFYIYFVAGQLAGRADVDNIYAAEVQERVGEEYYERAQRSGSELRKYDAQRRRRLDNVSSPFLYTTMRRVSRDYERALTQYHVAVLVAFIGGTMLLCRWRGYGVAGLRGSDPALSSRDPATPQPRNLSWAATLFLIAGLLTFYRGFEADLRVGNVNSLQLFALGVAVWSPPVVAGAILGMLICFKPNLILVAVLLACAHEKTRLKREMLGGFIGALIAFAAAAISYGPKSWLQWVTAANQFWHRLPSRGERNVAPFLELFHRHGEWLGYVIAAVLTIVVCIAIRRSRQRDDVLIAGLGIVIYLLSATVVWLHYMVLVLPLAIALMRHRVTAVIALLALAAIAEEPFEYLTRVPVYPNDAKLIGPALVVLFVAGVWRLWTAAAKPPL